MRLFLLFICFIKILLFSSGCIAGIENGSITLYGNKNVDFRELSLNDEELLWLAHKRSIIIAVYETDLPPLSISDDTGRYRGINADYLQIMKGALGITIKIKRFHDLQEATNALKNGDVDLVLTAPGDTVKMQSPFISSLPLVKGYPILVSRKSEMFKQRYTTNERVTIAITHQYPTENFINNYFPKATIVTYSDEYEALESVVKMRSDFYLGNHLTASSAISQDFNQLLVITKFWHGPLHSNYFLAMNSHCKLIDIINNFIRSLDEPLHNKITQSWIKMGSLFFLTHPIDLSPQEKRWLERHGTLRVLINPYYAPFSMINSSIEVRGIIADIMNIIHLQTSMTFIPITANSNSEMAEIIRRGEWDIIPTATYSTERAEEIAFSNPFIATPFVMVMRADRNGDITYKPGMKIAIPVYHTLSAKLKKEHIDIKWLDVDSTSVALSLLEQGKVDAVITTQLTSCYYIEHYYRGKLVYSRIGEELRAQISFALPRSEPELLSIINKALENIPTSEVLDIANKWTTPTNLQIETWNLYSRPFYTVVILAVVFVLIFLVWSVSLLKMVRREKASQNALQYQLKLRKTLFNAIPVPVYVMNEEGRIESYNHAFDSFFDTELKNHMQLSMFDSRHPMATLFQKMQYEIMKGLKPDMVISDHLTLNNGQEDRQILYWMTLCHQPLNLVPKFLCGWQDITESRQLMQALQTEKDKAICATQAKSIFLASMSHEIRTPLNAIMGFIELISTGNQSPQENEESLKLAYSTAQSLIGLIGDVLDIEKIESGNFEPKSEWVNPKALICSTLNNFEGLATQKRIHLTSHYSPHEECMLWLDPQVIKQVLANLISNSIKFTTEGGVDVYVELCLLDRSQAQLTLRVQDTGIGISDQEQQLLFKPFSQANNGKQHMGSGLGLAITRELVQRSGGNIKMTSLPGMGTIVTVTLLTRFSKQIPEVLKPIMRENTSPTALRILIVDDHKTNRLLLRRQLYTLGYDVTEACDGVEVLTLINHHNYDLMITDVNMPRMDGITLTQRVRESNNDIIIWGITANALDGEKERCMRSGMNLCLFKPIQLNQLQNALNDVKVFSTRQMLGNVITFETLQELTSNDKALMHTMLEQFAKENEKDILKARSALRERNIQLVRHHIHRINGTAQMIGAIELQKLSEILENALTNTTEIQYLEAHFNMLEKLLIDLNKIIKQFLDCER